MNNKALFIITTLLLIFALPAFAGGDQPSLSDRIASWGREQQSLQKPALISAVFVRCQHYLSFNLLNPIEVQKAARVCGASAQDMINHLDPRIVRFNHPLSDVEMQLQVAFPKELLDLISSPLTNTFLRSWKSALQLASIGLRPLDTYALAVKNYSQEDKALEIMAVLFQDTSEAKVHLQYLKRFMQRPTTLMIQNFQLLDEVIELSIKILSGRYKTRSLVSFYPQSVLEKKSGKVGQRIYHYYVPAYLALKLKRSGHSATAAFLAPFLFNYIYEVVEDSQPLLGLVSEIQSLDKVDDSYLGYLGALQGSKARTNFISPSVFAQLMKTPEDSLFELSQNLVRHNGLFLKRARKL